MKKILKRYSDKFKINIRKYIAVALTLLMIPLCSITSSAYEFEYLSYPWMNNWKVYYGTKLSSVQDESYETTKNSLNVYTYEFSSTSALTVEKLFFGNDLADFLYPYDSSRYTYKFVGAFVFDYKVGEFNPNTVMLEDIVIHQFNNGDLVSSDSVTNLVVDKKTNLDGVVFNFNFDLPTYNTLNVIELQFNPVGKYTDRDTSRIKITGSVIAVPKETSDESTNAIIDAIHDQTDVIENGNDETQDAVSDFEEVFDNFNEELENIEDFDNQVIEDFTAANEEYLTQLENFSLSGSLLNAGNWLSSSMQTIYDNSSDYKMLWLVPLLLGVPLMILFLKKGGDNE